MLGKIDNAHRVEWRWFSPDGNLHDSYANQISKPSGSPWEWYNVYSFIPIAGYGGSRNARQLACRRIHRWQKVLTEQFSLLTQNVQQPSGASTSLMQGGRHNDPATDKKICVDTINDFSNPERNVQGGCHTDPTTGQTTCVETIGDFSNPTGYREGSNDLQLEASSSVPQSMQECETYASEICGTWTLEGSHINAVWNSGATATLNVEQFDNTTVVFIAKIPKAHRQD